MAIGQLGVNQYFPQTERAEREHRFLLARDQAEAFIKRVEPWLALEVYDPERPIAYSRTTYLDTDDFAYFRSCEQGAKARRLRVREYAAASALGEPPLLTGISFIEYKESSGAFRHKARFAAPPEVIAALLSGQELTPEWRTRLAAVPEIAVLEEPFRQHLLAPRMTTWYRRVSLSAPGVRITLDEGISFCRPMLLGQAGELAEPTEHVAGGPGRIIEVKVQDALPPWLAEAMEGLEEALSFSKFLAGTAAVRQSRKRAVWRRATIPIPVTAGMQIKQR